MCGDATVPYGSPACTTCAPPSPPWLARQARRTGAMAATGALVAVTLAATALGLL